MFTVGILDIKFNRFNSRGAQTIDLFLIALRSP